MKFLLTLAFSVIAFALSSQPVSLNVLKKADKSFEEFSYADAVTYYKYALKNSTDSNYVTSQIALSFRNLNNPDSAEVWFKRAIDQGESKPEFRFYLAEALLSNQKYPEAKYWYELYENSKTSDSRSTRKLAALDNFDSFFSNIDKTDIKLSLFNSPGLDFSPTFYQNSIIFVSSRPKSDWVNREFNWDESNFLDLYITNDSTSEATYYDAGLNTKYHEGPLVFYNDDKSVVYTRNNYEGRHLVKDEKGVTNLKIFFANWDKKNNKWINEQPFTYNNNNFSIGSPAITEDGNTLIFSSNMTGGLGNSDLYVSYLENGKWSQPKNLGNKVNSKGRDGFPYIYKNELYFASEGREGLGGLDIYKIGFDGEKVTGSATNLGAPFNSNRDDFGIILKQDIGYFSSNREKKNSDDIYKFHVKVPKYIGLIGEVYDVDTDTPIAQSDVFLKDSLDNRLYTRSGANGEYQIKVPAHSKWTITAGKYDYELVSPLFIATDTTSEMTVERIYLKKLRDIETSDSLAIPDVIELADNRVKTYNKTSTFIDDFLIGDTLKLDMIYYDLDSYALRQKHKNHLDSVAMFMIEHVDVTILLASHTDSRSSISYNKTLSKNRSKSVKRYLIAKGVIEKRLISTHWGEAHLTNDCHDEVECQENLHQMNRRTELSFVKTNITP